MIFGKWKRIEFEFRRLNEETGEYEFQREVAHTMEDVDRIQQIKMYMDDKCFQTKVKDCACGKEIACTSFTNTCECGRDHGWDGSELAPREQWGEETGEHWMDCY